MHALPTSKHDYPGYKEIQADKELRKQIAKLSFNPSGWINAYEVVIAAECVEALSCP